MRGAGSCRSKADHARSSPPQILEAYFGGNVAKSDTSSGLRRLLIPTEREPAGIGGLNRLIFLGSIPIIRSK